MTLTRGVAFVIGLFLLAVWIAGLTLHATAWITWLDFVGGILALLIAVAVVERTGAARTSTASFPILVSLGLFAVWIVALATGAARWITWCTFAAACGLLLDGIGGFSTKRTQPA